MKLIAVIISIIPTTVVASAVIAVRLNIVVIVLCLCYYVFYLHNCMICWGDPTRS